VTHRNKQYKTSRTDTIPFNFQLTILATVLAVARAEIIGALGIVSPGAPLAYGATALSQDPLAYAAPAAAKVAAPVAVDTDYEPNPQYSYAYDIQHALTGNSKGQQESRSGDVVQGSYSLVEPDGTRRTVEYTADPVNGFNAVVHREPAVVAASVAKVATPIAYAASAVAKFTAPAAYAAPLHTKVILG
jgi:hypothetical protein